MNPSMSNRISNVLEYKVSHVRTPAGVERFGLPIGSPIVAHTGKRVVSGEKVAKKATTAVKKAVKESTVGTIHGKKKSLTGQSFLREEADRNAKERALMFSAMFDELTNANDFTIEELPSTPEAFGTASNFAALTARGADGDAYDITWSKNRGYEVDIRGTGGHFSGRPSPSDVLHVMRNYVHSHAEANMVYEESVNLLDLLTPDAHRLNVGQTNYLFTKHNNRLRDAIEVFTGGIEGKHGVVEGIREGIRDLAAGDEIDPNTDFRIASAARSLFDAIHDYPRKAGQLYRGMSLDDDEMESFSKKFAEGNTVDIGLSSYSSDFDTAVVFSKDSGGKNRIMLFLAEGSQSLPVERLSVFPEEFEWINGGRYRITRFLKPDPTGLDGMVDSYQIEMEQVRSI